MHRIGDHAKVFTANEHVGGGRQGAEAPEGRVAPKIVVAHKEEIGVKAIEGGALPLGQRAVTQRAVGRDARVIVPGRIGIFQEEHLLGEAVERIAQAPGAVIVVSILKQRSDLSLGVTKGVRGKVYVVDRREVTCRQLIRFVAEKPREMFASDHGSGVTHIEGQPESLDLVRGERQRRSEMSAEAAHIIEGDLPNAEEPKDMVYAEAVEVFAQLLESRLPPSKAIALHHLPVVSREAPVLPHDGEVVGRRTGLLLWIEARRVSPRIHACPIDTDRQIALEDHTPAARIVGHVAELRVQDILQEAVVAHLARLHPLCIEQRTHPINVVPRIVAPAGEVGRTVQVAVVTENGVRHEPRAVLPDETAIASTAHHLRPRLAEVGVAVGRLFLHHRLIIHLWQRVQLALRTSKDGHLQLVFQCAHVGQRDVHRVEGVDGDGAVGIRVAAGVRGSRVVHRQHLHDALSRLRGPIDEESQVVQVAHAEARLRSQREDGDHRAGSLPSRAVDVYRFLRDGNDLVLPRLGVHLQSAVVSVLPVAHLSRRVADDELVFKREGERVQV